MKLAPIALFVYNRPEHTCQTLTALKNNSLSSESELHIFADGPKNNASTEQLNNIRMVREIIHAEQWCGNVVYHESETNKGLYQSIRLGVTEVLNQCGKVIVMEDDIVTSPAFLSYMNQALDYYQDRKSVFSISGYNYPSNRMQIPKDYLYDTYVCLRNASWGWATWQDRWTQIDWDVKVYDKVKNTPAIKEALNRMGDDEFDMLRMRQEGILNIWSIQFTMAHFVNHAVAIYPVISYVHNIGNDGSGENCCATEALDNKVLCTNMNPKFVDILYEDSRLINAFYNLNCRMRRPLWQKFVNFIVRKLGKKSLFVIKKKIYC